jgi:hypothetical protein
MDFDKLIIGTGNKRIVHFATRIMKNINWTVRSFSSW